MIVNFSEGFKTRLAQAGIASRCYVEKTRKATVFSKLKHKFATYRVDVKVVSMSQSMLYPINITWVDVGYFYFWQYSKARKYCYESFHEGILNNDRRVVEIKTGFVEFSISVK